MLLTNTINTLTVNTTFASGNVITCVVEFRGCSACPAHVADRPSEKPAVNRLREHSVPAPGQASACDVFGQSDVMATAVARFADIAADRPGAITRTRSKS